MEAASARLAKVVFILGATGTGKSKLAIELSTRFSGEVINSDKIQVYQGMDVVTNKVTAEEESLVRHHLLNLVDDPDADFTAEDFRHEVVRAVESIISQGKVPIIAGGSNSYIEALVDEDFRRKYQTCFFWLDVELTVLHTSVSRRVDRMVEGGLVEEVRTAFHPEGDYSRGIRRAIGVPEMDRYFRAEAHLEPAARAILLAEAIDEIKANTCKLTCSQRGKILKFRDHLRWDIHSLDATEVFLLNGTEAEEAWEVCVLRPAEAIVSGFLIHDRQPNAVGPASMAEEAIITSAVPLAVGALSSPVE